MKQKIRHFLILTIFLLSLSFLASCQKVQKEQDTQYSDSQPAGKQKIICYDVTVSAPYMEDLVKVFNAQSSTTEVEMRYLEDSEYEDRLNKLLEEGGQADVIWLRQPSKSNRMAEAGQLFDLSQLVGGSALDISKYGQSLDIVKLDESIYSLPFIQNIWLLFYNRDIFDGLHMDYPGQMTWEEYADLAARIDGTAPDGQKRWGGYLPIWVPNLGALELGEYLYDDELPATKEFLQLMDRLYNQDHSHPNPVEMEEIYTPGYEAFLDGGIGMMINGDWTIQILQNLEASGTVSCRWRRRFPCRRAWNREPLWGATPTWRFIPAAAIRKMPLNSWSLPAEKKGPPSWPPTTASPPILRKKAGKAISRTQAPSM